MNLNPTWNRRTFVTTLGLTTAAATLPAESVVASDEPAPAPTPGGPHLAFVSHARFCHGGQGLIMTFRVDGGHWTPLFPFWRTLYPYALVPHPTLPILYTAAQTGVYDPNQRQGHATAISFDGAHPMTHDAIVESGQHWFKQLQQHRLPLDSNYPSDVAISPDGRRLLVSDFSGGLYSVFPIAADGALLPVEHVLKLTGGATDTAHPDGLVFHPSGRLAYSTDCGTDQMHVISFDQPKPAVTASYSFAPRSQPKHLALHPSGRSLLVANRSGVLSVLALDPSSGELLGQATHHRVSATDGVETLVINAAGDRAYVVTRWYTRKSYNEPSFTWAVHTYRLSRTGAPVRLHRLSIPNLWTITRATLHDGNLILLGENGIVSAALDPRTGLPSEPRHVFEGGDYTGIVFRPI